jgi:hypothetical protein
LYKAASSRATTASKRTSRSSSSLQLLTAAATAALATETEAAISAENEWTLLGNPSIPGRRLQGSARSSADDDDEGEDQGVDVVSKSARSSRSSGRGRGRGKSCYDSAQAETAVLDESFSMVGNYKGGEGMSYIDSLRRTIALESSKKRAKIEERHQRREEAEEEEYVEETPMKGDKERHIGTPFSLLSRRYDVSTIRNKLCDCLAVALQSMRNRCAFDVPLIGSCFASALRHAININAQSMRSRNQRAVDAQLLCDCLATVWQLLC